MLAVCSFDSAL